MTTSNQSDREIIYVGDPMCSWCWGFAPVARQLQADFADRAAFRIIAGGLRPGEHAAPLDDELKASIRPQWDQVKAMTGQPFDYRLFETDGYLYDTEPACRAVVCARRIDPARALDVFMNLQAGFYQQGRDVTDTDVIVDIVTGCGLDRDVFVSAFQQPAAAEYTLADFAVASRLGAQAFPTVFLRNGDDVALLTMGYQSAVNLVPAVERYFS